MPIPTGRCADPKFRLTVFEVGNAHRLGAENRVIELFGGQITETEVCSESSCCSGDVFRIDELARLIVGPSGYSDPEAFWFELEDLAEIFFDDQCYRNAIIPIAEFLQQRVLDGWDITDGDDLEVELGKYVSVRPKVRGLKKFLPFGA